MRKYLVNYRELNPTVYTSYTEHRTIYETEVEKYYVDENTGEKFIVLIDPKTGKKREYYCAENGIFFSDEDIYKVCPISWLKKCNKCCLFSMEYEYYEHTNTYEPHN